MSLKSSSFEIFGERKYGLFLSQKVDGKMVFTNYWKVFVLIFSEMENTVFFPAKTLMERLYLQITKKVLFWTSRRCKIWSFLSQKVDGRMMFIWSFKTLHDIPGLGKYGFLCSDIHIHCLPNKPSTQSSNSFYDQI